MMFYMIHYENIIKVRVNLNHDWGMIWLINFLKFGTQYFEMWATCAFQVLVQIKIQICQNTELGIIEMQNVTASERAGFNTSVTMKEQPMYLLFHTNE